MTLKQTVWRSPLYVGARRAAARLSRPLRRAEVVVVSRCDLTRPLPDAPAGVPFQAYVASRREVLDDIGSEISQDRSEPQYRNPNRDQARGDWDRTWRHTDQEASRDDERQPGDDGLRPEYPKS